MGQIGRESHGAYAKVKATWGDHETSRRGGVWPRAEREAEEGCLVNISFGPNRIGEYDRVTAAHTAARNAVMHNSNIVGTVIVIAVLHKERDRGGGLGKVPCDTLNPVDLWMVCTGPRLRVGG